MAKVIRELLTKIGYKVDSQELEKAIKNTDRLKMSTRQLNNELKKLKGGLNSQRAAQQKTNASASAFKNKSESVSRSLKKQKNRTDSLKRSQMQLSASTASLGSQMSSLMSMARGIGLAFGAVGAGFGFIMKQTGDMEQAQVAMEGLLQSEEKANKMMTDLKKLAVETPFELKDVFKGTNQLLAYNISADKMIDTLTSLGNIASVVGTQKLPQLILAYGQVSTAGRLRGQEVRQFTEAGVPVNEIIAKQMKVTKAEVSDLVSAGKVSFEIVQAAIQDYANGTGKVSGMMAKQSKTLHGRISNLKDIIAITSAEIGNNFLPMTKSLVTETRKWIQTNKELIKTNIVKFFNNAEKVFGDFLVIVKSGWRTLTTVTKLFGGLENSVLLLGKALAIVFGAKSLMLIGSFVMKFKAIGNVMFWVQAKAMAVPLAIGAAIVGVMLLIDDFINWQQGNKSVLGLMLGDYSTATSPLSKLFSMDFVDGVKKTILELWNWIKNLFDDLFTKDFWSNRLQDLKSVFDEVFTTEGRGESGKKYGEDVQKDFKEKGFWETIITRFGSLGGGLGTSPNVKSDGNGIFDNLTRPAGQKGTTINNKFDTTVNMPQGVSVDQGKEMISDALRETAAKTPATTDQ